MSEAANLLMLEFLSWLSSRPRTYEETMEAWQSRCPRQTIWEDAINAGYIRFNRSPAADNAEVALTPRGLALLNGHNFH